MHNHSMHGVAGSTEPSQKPKCVKFSPWYDNNRVVGRCAGIIVGKRTESRYFVGSPEKRDCGI